MNLLVTARKELKTVGSVIEQLLRVEIAKMFQWSVYCEWIVQLIFSASASRKQKAEPSEVVFAATNLARILQEGDFAWSMLSIHFHKLQAEQGLDEGGEFDKVLFGFKEAVSTNYLRDNNPDDNYKVLNAVKASLDTLKCDPKKGIR
jgi:hypothetical protein